MENCKTCQHLIQSKNHLDQGLCNKIIPIGNRSKYIEGKLTLASEQGAAILSDELSWILVNINDFGCKLYEEIEEHGIPVENQAIPEKNPVQPKNIKPTKDNF